MSSYCTFALCCAHKEVDFSDNIKFGVVVLYLCLCHFGNPEIFLCITASDTNQPMLLNTLSHTNAHIQRLILNQRVRGTRTLESVC